MNRTARSLAVSEPYDLGANYFTPTEVHRRALDRLWRRHDRLAARVAAGKGDESELSDLRRTLEDTICANDRGFSSAAEARRQ